ncbi:MAG: fumarate reductase subunit FrdD [Candidatus Binataceae bacterium]
MAARRSNRPLAWLLFGTGGFLVAFFFPIHIFLTGFAEPLGLVATPSRASMLTLLEHPLTRLYLAVLLIFAFWHAAYRLRDTICDALDVRRLDVVVVSLCYAGATVGTIATIVLLACVP